MRRQIRWLKSAMKKSADILPSRILLKTSDQINSPFHAGAAAQNVYLYATSKGLNTIVRGYIDKDELKDKLRLNRDEFVIMNQVIGYPES